MTWPAWVCLIVFVIAVLGPLRRPFLSRWRFTVPGSIAGWLGYYVAASVWRPGDPWWGAAVVGVLAGLGCGAATKRWLDEQLKEE